MAHNTENEETEFKAVPESRTLCINCGVAGISSAKICQVCFNATASSSTVKTRRSVSIKSPEEIRSDRKSETTDDNGGSISVVKKEVNRCLGCRKKVGLTGIRCRCGELFCSAHRYSDRHDCSYDYKAAGRDAILRENPVVKAAKIVRI